MAELVKAPAAKPNDISSVPVTHMIKEKTNLKELSSDLHMPMVA